MSSNPAHDTEPLILSSTSSSSSKPTKQSHHYKYDLFRFYENMSVESPIRDGLIVNWDMLEDLWEHCLTSYLRLNHNASPLNLSEFPLLFAETPYRDHAGDVTDD